MKVSRWAVVVGGHGLAAGAGVLAVWLKNRELAEADHVTSSGAFELGDLVLFVWAASFVALVPTVVLFRLLDPSPRVWHRYGRASLAVALTGPFGAAFAFLVSRQHDLLRGLSNVGAWRVMAAPFFLLCHAPTLLRAAGANRKFGLGACVLEVATAGSLVVWLSWLMHQATQGY